MYVCKVNPSPITGPSLLRRCAAPAAEGLKTVVLDRVSLSSMVLLVAQNGPSRSLGGLNLFGTLSISRNAIVDLRVLSHRIPNVCQVLDEACPVGSVVCPTPLWRPAPEETCRSDLRESGAACAPDWLRATYHTFEKL